MCFSILQEALDPVTCYSINPLRGSNETQRLTIAVGKWCCGRNIDNIRTKVVKDVSHMGEGTPIISRLYRLQANTYLVKRVINKHDRIAVASCLASFHRNVAIFTRPRFHPFEVLGVMAATGCLDPWCMIG